MTGSHQMVDGALAKAGSHRAAVERLLLRWSGHDQPWGMAVLDGQLDELRLLLELRRLDFLTIESEGRPTIVLAGGPLPAEALAFAAKGAEPGRLPQDAAQPLVLMRLAAGCELRLSEGWATGGI